MTWLLILEHYSTKDNIVETSTKNLLIIQFCIYFDFRCFHLLQYLKRPRGLLAGDQVFLHWLLSTIIKSKAAKVLSLEWSDHVSLVSDIMK